MKKFLIGINRDIFKMSPEIFLLNHKQFFLTFAQVFGLRTETGVR